jgi:hypothetical protein
VARDRDVLLASIDFRFDDFRRLCVRRVDRQHHAESNDHGSKYNAAVTFKTIPHL